MRAIRLYDSRAILPQTLIVRCRPNDDPSWDVASIEIYSDFDCVNLIADDIQIGSLTPSSQMSIFAALNAFDHEERQREFAAKVRAEYPRSVA